MLLGTAFMAIGLWAWAEKSNLMALVWVIISSKFSRKQQIKCCPMNKEQSERWRAFLGSEPSITEFKGLDPGLAVPCASRRHWSCCGAHGPNDWNFNIYFNCTDSNPSRERCGVPFSCCVKDPAEDVLNTQCGYDVRLKLELEQQTFIHTKGCAVQFEKWLQDNLIVVAGTFVGIALLQIFGICLAQNLVNDINAVKANW
uniref:Uncharacterized protein n=1 Tax=Sphaerodactylus townsendi TaxID=933632 RepID=A0ACB8EJ67_9SAUR